MIDDDGLDRTPKGMKERGLLALLAFAPSNRRSRSWLQDKLWSDRSPDQASTSFRRALSNIRKVLGPSSNFLGADRTNVWFTRPVRLDFGEEPSSNSEVLEDVDVPDAEFENWIRDLRQEYQGDTQTNRLRQPPIRRPDITTVVVSVPNSTGSHNEDFLALYAAGLVSDRLQSLSDVGLLVERSDGERVATSNGVDLVIDVQSLMEGDSWFLHTGVFAQPHRRFLWSGRLRLPVSFDSIWKSPELSEFVGRVVTSIIQRNARKPFSSKYFAIQAAAKKMFDGNRGNIEEAVGILESVNGEMVSGVALAWLGFARLTNALEFGENDPENVEYAKQLSGDAIARAPSNPLVLALAAQIQLKLAGDFEYGHHLSDLALECCDQNPYALDSMSQACFFRGEYDRGLRLANWAQQSAKGLPNAFFWDMQCCLSALSLGCTDEAIDHARLCHIRMPTYRPALRYLITLNLLAGRDSDAARFETKLRSLEPDFSLQRLMHPDYPLETLRTLGLGGDLKARL
ncbi:hypothetical protein SLH49_21985 [Cognatiyoonia sp. IB215446]|uniref:AfsR/SARP family transcriptional regulator n=1 Tax=Cognatiyoonia sp. IB215446 TaxID=3097355 RepID=UPI002A17E581|nr:hypothetical protein [Cognatiyoonia sp. IB215446]MDX8350669.1 hypothetical protein [Cognatiyoonia sp. IB215446]